MRIVKTTFDYNFDLYQAFKHHGYTKRGNKEKLSVFELLIRKKLFNNQNLNLKSCFHCIDIIVDHFFLTLAITKNFKSVFKVDFYKFDIN